MTNDGVVKNANRRAAEFRRMADGHSLFDIYPPLEDSPLHRIPEPHLTYEADSTLNPEPRTSEPFRLMN
jgi:hypothetical protein